MGRLGLACPGINKEKKKNKPQKKNNEKTKQKIN